MTNTTRRTKSAAGSKLGITGATVLAGAQAAAKKAPAKRTARKTTTPKHFDNVPETDKPVAKKATAKKTTAKKAASNEPKVLKRDVAFEDRDWTYLDEKDPSIQQVLFAQQINMRTNIEIDAKQVQAVLAMHPYFQRSETNKKRPDYHGLDAVVVEQRSVHMKQAHADAKEILDSLAAESLKKPAAKKAPAKKTTAAAPAKRPARVTRKTTASAKKADAAF